jgi:hypothetical protein
VLAVHSEQTKVQWYKVCVHVCQYAGLQGFDKGPIPKGEKELFNYAHSSLRNVIEWSFGVLKMKLRILLALPSNPMKKQKQDNCYGMYGTL